MGDWEGGEVGEEEDEEEVEQGRVEGDGEAGMEEKAS